jgi:hypothetical protein
MGPELKRGVCKVKRGGSTLAKKKPRTHNNTTKGAYIGSIMHITTTNTSNRRSERKRNKHMDT